MHFFFFERVNLMKIEYNLIKTENNTKARLGTIKTNYGTVETPMFMPVGTKATIKGLSPEEVKKTGAGIVLANTYHLWLRPGEDIVSKAGGLHKFMNYDGPILTDSGGFQVFSLAKNKKKDITEEGVHFKSHIDGKALFLTPEKSIEIQNKLDSDIAMSFDECPPASADYEYLKNSVERTIRWAKRGKTVHSNKNQSLFGIVQGGAYEDLRKYSAIETVKLDFDGYSIGGVANDGESKEDMYEVQEELEDRFSDIPKPVETLLKIAYIKTLCKKLKIEKSKKSNDTITRTIRISGKTFDKINELAEKNELSFNSVINQIIEYGLENLEE